MGEKIYPFHGEVNAASLVKLAINFLILSSIQAMGEAFAFLKNADIDRIPFANMLTETLFNCKGYRYHAHNIARQNFLPAGFKMPLGLKDINLLQECAQNNNTLMPLADMLHESILASLKKGRDDHDWSAISMLPLENSRRSTKGPEKL